MGLQLPDSRPVRAIGQVPVDNISIFGFHFVAESVKDFVDALETLDEFRYLSRC